MGVRDRIHLETMGSPEFYRHELARLGFIEVGGGFQEHREQLITHYAR
ncbi:hypothetical protein JBE27_26325, partial [Streptomyces albiflaviniger]|nr:hypothetical protein [Streptomyces albiflaviniger]